MRSCVRFAAPSRAGARCPREWGPADTDGFFWQWFVQNSASIAKIRTAREPIAMSLGAQLRAIDKHLTFELGPPGPVREFIISADGVREAFPSVVRLVAAARAPKGWKVIAFRQRKPGLTVELEGIKLDPGACGSCRAPRRTSWPSSCSFPA